MSLSVVCFKYSLLSVAFESYVQAITAYQRNYQHSGNVCISDALLLMTFHS